MKFGPGCAGHGLLSVEKIEEGEELVLIPRSATLHHSDRLENEFKKFTKIKNHPWISVILSLMERFLLPLTLLRRETLTINRRNLYRLNGHMQIQNGGRTLIGCPT